MSDNSKIEWTESTWNPVLGCTHTSAGCDHCYAAREASGRLSGLPLYAGLANGGKFTGEVRLVPERLDQPMRWRRPRRIFVNSMSDLFHEAVPDDYIVQVFAHMWWAPQHTFQVLTKRHGRMRSLMPKVEEALRQIEGDLALVDAPTPLTWPLPNVWLGVSVESQQWADIRIPALLATPAAVRWLSCEPLLSALDLTRYLQGIVYSSTAMGRGVGGQMLTAGPGVDWVIVGGESGPKARAMHPDWARSLRDQCVAAGVPFLFKQWGEWGPAPWKLDREPGEDHATYKARAEAQAATHWMLRSAHEYDMQPQPAGHQPWSLERQHLPAGDPHAGMRRWGKKAAGRVLDGQTWDQYPDTERTQ